VEPPTNPSGPVGAAASQAHQGLRHDLLQFLRFCVVGGSGVIVNLAVFTATLLIWLLIGGHIHAGDLTSTVRELVTKRDTAGLTHAAIYVANALGFVVSVFTNYYLNRHWTFRSTKSVTGELPKFFTVSVVAYAGQLAIFWALHTHAHTAPIPSQLAAIVFVMPINFIANKLWSFR
jgi:putative flippase GtrA